MTTRADRINYLITKVQRDVHRLEKLGRLTPQEVTFIRSKLVHQNDKACNATLPELSSPYFTLGVPVISIKAQSGYEHELKFERGQLLIVTDLG